MMGNQYDSAMRLITQGARGSHSAIRLIILCRLSKTRSVAELVRELKRESSKWLKEQSTELADFYWQSGYGAFSISPGHVQALTSYIANQEEHHKTETFQSEYLRLLKLYEIEYDEEYLWEE